MLQDSPTWFSAALQVTQDGSNSVSTACSVAGWPEPGQHSIKMLQDSPTWFSAALQVLQDELCWVSTAGSVAGWPERVSTALQAIQDKAIVDR
jgi:hypothetical protein